MRRLAELSESKKDYVFVMCCLVLVAFLLNLYSPTEWITMFETTQRFFNYARY